MSTPLDRRAFMGYFSTIGLGSTLLPGVLWAQVARGAEITAATIACAEEIAGLSFEPAEREMMVAELRDQAEQIATLHSIPLANDVPPALHFDPLGVSGVDVPLPAAREGDGGTRVAPGIGAGPPPAPRTPSDVEGLAFHTVAELSELVRTRRLSSLELTEMYLARLERLDPALHFAVTITRERALAQARERDAELARGIHRGPLHGIPWGAKDLLAVKGYPTTWGTGPFRTQRFDEDATVVRRLDEAGAVLVAKLTLGELAYGDVWFGGMTRNPWKADQGSSGSSAGSASATVAGAVGFAIGSETLGSISSPSTRTGATGLRPTFGRVPRTGAMALSWSMDKLGPICRSVEDCALVFDAIQGPDGHDRTVRSAPFAWSPSLDPRTLRVGYFHRAFERDEKSYPNRAHDHAALDVLRSLGVTLRPVDVPEAKYSALGLILSAEAAAAFDELTRTGRDAEMTRQTAEAWPNLFRAARFIPAVDYINANRVRTMVMRQWHALMKDLDVIVTPTGGSSQLVATNYTGHPAVILPNGHRDTDGTPVSITFLGQLYGEEKLLALAHAYQQATDFHRKHPAM